MRAILFTPDRDTVGRRDYSAAFAPEARAFAKLHGIPSSAIVPIDVARPRAQRNERVLTVLAHESLLDCVAFFCHGLRSGLQVGPDNASVLELAHALRNAGTPTLRVALYACSAGEGPGPGGDGGFADRLRDALCAAGLRDCRVDAHSTAGHATQNPYVRRFEGGGSPVGGTGGTWIVGPSSPLWKPWVRALKGEMRLCYPLLSVAEVHHQLLAATGDVA
jgi:hypothetical protein